jgi:hypothetical protein
MGCPRTEILKLDDSCISNPKFEISVWTQFNLIFRISDLRCRNRPISKFSSIVLVPLVVPVQQAVAVLEAEAAAQGLL